MAATIAIRAQTIVDSAKIDHQNRWLLRIRNIMFSGGQIEVLHTDYVDCCKHNNALELRMQYQIKRIEHRDTSQLSFKVYISDGTALHPCLLCTRTERRLELEYHLHLMCSTILTPAILIAPKTPLVVPHRGVDIT